MSESVKRRIFSGKLLLLVLLIFGVALYYLDAAVTRGPSAEEQAQEDQLWSWLDSLSKDSQAFFKTALELRGKAYSSEDYSESRANDDDNDDDDGQQAAEKGGQAKPVIFDVAEYRRISAAFDQRFRAHRQELEKLAESDKTGYIGDAKLKYALYYQNFNVFSALYEDQIYTANLKNSNPRNNWSKLESEDYYKLYCAENRDKAFIYPFIKDLMRNPDQSAYAVDRWCALGHGGFLLWRGMTEKDVRKALSTVGTDGVYSTSQLLKASKVRCLELRQKHGSFLAPLGLMLCRGFDGLLKYKPINILKINYSRNPQFFTDVMPVPVYYRVRTAEDKVWELAHYLSLSADNYLWMVKFRDKNNRGSAFMEKCRIRELYDKNGPQMQHYRDYLALDVQSCRLQLDTPEYKKVPALRQATLDLCSGIEEILSDWDRYREGKVDYKKFVANIKQDEANLEKLRYGMLSARWDYLYDLCGFDYYVMCLMVYEGAPEPLTVKLFEEK